MGCQLPVSQNNAISPRWGTIWSTTVAAVTAGKHFTHSGCCRSHTARAARHSCVYPRLYALPLRSSKALCGAFWCLLHLPDVVSVPHPAWAHGFGAFLGIAQQKAPKSHGLGASVRFRNKFSGGSLTTTTECTIPRKSMTCQHAFTYLINCPAIFLRLANSARSMTCPSMHLDTTVLSEHPSRSPSHTNERPSYSQYS